MYNRGESKIHTASQGGSENKFTPITEGFKEEVLRESRGGVKMAEE